MVHGLPGSKNKQSFQGDLPEAKKQNNPKGQPSFHCPERTQVLSHFTNSPSTLLCCYGGRIYLILPNLVLYTWRPGCSAHQWGKVWSVSQRDQRRLSKPQTKGVRKRVERENLRRSIGDKGDTLTRQRAQSKSRRPPFIGPNQTPHLIESGKEERERKRESKRVL
jgi:hypothetical protein